MLFIISFLSLLGCGNSKNSPHYANQNNFSDWKSYWDQKTWIIMSKEDVDKPEAFLQNLVQNIKGSFGFIPTEKITDEKLTLLSPKPIINTVQNYLQNSISNTDHDHVIHIVKFPTFQNWDSLAGLQGFDTESDEKKISKMFSFFYQDQNILWVEPDLYTPILRPYQGKSEMISLDSTASNVSSTTPIDPYAPPATSTDTGPRSMIKATDALTYLAQNKTKLSEVVIAVMDTGVDYLHTQLKNRMWNNPYRGDKALSPSIANMDIGQLHGIDGTVAPSERKDGGEADVQGPGKPCVNDSRNQGCGHGTHVAGIIAAEYNSQSSMYGICPICKILSIRVAERQTYTDDKNNTVTLNGQIGDSAQIRGFTYLFNLRKPGKPNELIVNVINGSFGKIFKSQTMSYLIKRLQEYNVILTAASGNENTDIPSYPAAYKGVVSVCALGVLPGDDSRCGIYDKAYFSNYGDWVSLCAPGTNILSTVPGDANAKDSGTSQAAPFVAGLFGVMLAYNQNKYTADQLITMAKKSADSQSVYNAPCNKNLYAVKESGTNNLTFHMLGSGLINMVSALSQKSQSQVNEDAELGRVTGGCVMSSVTLSSMASLKELVGWLFVVLGVLLMKRFRYFGTKDSSTDH